MVEINYESQGTYNVSNQIKSKTSVIRSNLCDYSGTYIHVKGTITVPNTEIAAAPNNRNKKSKFSKLCSIKKLHKWNNTQVDAAHDINVVMAMYNLIEYSDAYLKTWNLLQYYRDEPMAILLIFLMTAIIFIKI